VGPSTSQHTRHSARRSSGGALPACHPWCSSGAAPLISYDVCGRCSCLSCKLPAVELQHFPGGCGLQPQPCIDCLQCPGVSCHAVALQMGSRKRHVSMQIKYGRLHGQLLICVIFKARFKPAWPATPSNSTMFHNAQSALGLATLSTEG